VHEKQGTKVKRNTRKGKEKENDGIVTVRQQG